MDFKTAIKTAMNRKLHGERRRLTRTLAEEVYRLRTTTDRTFREIGYMMGGYAPSAMRDYYRRHAIFDSLPF